MVSDLSAIIGLHRILFRNLTAMTLLRIFSMNYNTAYPDQQMQQQQAQQTQQPQGQVQPQQQQWNLNQNGMAPGGMMEQSGIPATPLDDGLGVAAVVPSSYNQKTSERMRADEGRFLLISISLSVFNSNSTRDHRNNIRGRSVQFEGKKVKLAPAFLKTD